MRKIRYIFFWKTKQLESEIKLKLKILILTLMAIRKIIFAIYIRQRKSELPYIWGGHIFLNSIFNYTLAYGT